MKNLWKLHWFEEENNTSQTEESEPECQGAEYDDLGDLDGGKSPG